MLTVAIPAVGTRYESKRRPGQFVQVEGVQGGTDQALVALLYLKSRQRVRTPYWLFKDRFRRCVVGPLEKGTA
jgi:hypothetical protein